MFKLSRVSSLPTITLTVTLVQLHGKLFNSLILFGMEFLHNRLYASSVI